MAETDISAGAYAIPQMRGSESCALLVQPDEVERFRQISQLAEDVEPQFVAAAVLGGRSKRHPNDEAAIEHARALSDVDRYLRDHPETPMLGMDAGTIYAGITYRNDRGLTIRNEDLPIVRGIYVASAAIANMRIFVGSDKRQFEVTGQSRRKRNRICLPVPDRALTPGNLNLLASPGDFVMAVGKQAINGLLSAVAEAEPDHPLNNYGRCPQALRIARALLR